MESILTRRCSDCRRWDPRRSRGEGHRRCATGDGEIEWRNRRTTRVGICQRIAALMETHTVIVVADLEPGAGAEWLVETAASAPVASSTVNQGARAAGAGSRGRHRGRACGLDRAGRASASCNTFGCWAAMVATTRRTRYRSTTRPEPDRVRHAGRCQMHEGLCTPATRRSGPGWPVPPLVEQFQARRLTWWPEIGIGYYPVEAGLEPYDQVFRQLRPQCRHGWRWGADAGPRRLCRAALPRTAGRCRDRQRRHSSVRRRSHPTSGGYDVNACGIGWLTTAICSRPLLCSV